LLGSPHRHEASILQHSKQLDLKRRTHLAQLIKKKRAAVSDLKEPLLIPHCARESAFHMTKKL